MDDVVYLSPVGKSTDATVIDEIISLDLTTEVIVVFYLFLGIIAVYGPELYASLAAPVYSILKELAFSHAPKDEAVVVLDKHTEGFRGKR